MKRAQTFSTLQRWRCGAIAVVPALALCAASAFADASSTQLYPTAAFSQPVNGRTPAGVFVTELGVYELDVAAKTVRIWQRSDEGLELLRPPDAADFVPYTDVQIEAATGDRRPQRFMGLDHEGRGMIFKQPVGMAKHPSANRFAVVSAGEFISQESNQYSPSILVYDFEEHPATNAVTLDVSLGGVRITHVAEYANAFHETTNNWQQVVDHVFKYGGLEYCTTNLNADGTAYEWYYGSRRTPLSWTNVEVRVIGGVSNSATNVLWYGPFGTNSVCITNAMWTVETYSFYNDNASVTNEICVTNVVDAARSGSPEVHGWVSVSNFVDNVSETTSCVTNARGAEVRYNGFRGPGTASTPLWGTSVETNIVGGVTNYITNVHWYGPFGTDSICVTNETGSTGTTNWAEVTYSSGPLTSGFSCTTNAVGAEVLHYADATVRYADFWENGTGLFGKQPKTVFVNPVVVDIGGGETIRVSEPGDVTTNGVLHSFRAYPETTTTVTGADGVRYTLCGFPGAVVQVVLDASDPGRCLGFRATDLVSFETELLDRTITTNWVWVVEAPTFVTSTNDTSQTGLAEPYFNPTNFYSGLEYSIVSTNGNGVVSTNWVYVEEYTTRLFCLTNSTSQTGLEEPNFVNENAPGVLVEGLEFTFVATNDWTSVATNFYVVTNYVFRYDTTTNSSYLATATDVAFLGAAGIVVPISDCGYSEVYNDRKWGVDHWVTNRFSVSGLAVFDAEDPSRPCIVFPCATNLPGRIAGIDVDQETGDIYAAVPSASAVYRFKAPGAGPGSWVSHADRTVIVPDPDFVAGVPSQPSSGFGYLSSPEDVSVWRPDGGSPILLVADNANNRIAAFDVNATWSVTNWLGTTYNQDAETWSATGDWPTNVFEGAVGFAVSTNVVPVRKLVGLEYVTVWTEMATTNYYRIEKTAFPLFEVEAFDSFNNPGGVFGAAGENVLAAADTRAHRVLLFEVALDETESDEILAMAVYWPSGFSGSGGTTLRDFAVTNGSSGSLAAWWDALVPGAPAVPVHVARERDGYENALFFTVAPARAARTFSFSVEDADGVVVPVKATATVPAGETRGFFTFEAKDGVVTEESVVSWRDQYGNVVTNGDPKAVSAVTNLVATTPVYTFEISSDGASTNALLTVANVDPVITNALMIGYVVPGMPPVTMAQGLHVDAMDFVDADKNLRYLWWATTNVNWGVNNLDWAVRNNDWASEAGGDWSEGPSFEAVQNTTASVITGTETAGPVTNTVVLQVARGREVELPYGYAARGLQAGSEPGTCPILVVCTVLDKDGGAAIVAFPTPPEPSGTADLWTGVYDRGVTVDHSDESTARYAARFIAVSGTNVTFVVWKESGDSSVHDTVTLQSSTGLEGASNPGSANWTLLKRYEIGGMTFPATNNLTPAGTGSIRFYRVVQP